MTSREKFEAWMTAEQWFHGSDFEWDERRNCYAQFGIHLAYKAFLAAESAAEQKLTDMAVQLANAESKCRELAAENAVLKESVKHAAGCIAAAEAEGLIDALAETADERLAGLVHRRLCHAYLEVETPATDAFLAEVRASGVDEAIAELNQLADRSDKEAPIAAGHYRSEALFFKLFADKIRKGAAR